MPYQDSPGPAAEGGTGESGSMAAGEDHGL
jgi:hypothetical protein